MQAYTVMIPLPAPSAIVRATPGLVAHVGALRFTLTHVVPEFATYDFEEERASSQLQCASCRLRTTQLYQRGEDELCRACYERAASA